MTNFGAVGDTRDLIGLLQTTHFIKRLNKIQRMQ